MRYSTEIDEILTRVEPWPDEDRVLLASRLLGARRTADARIGQKPESTAEVGERPSLSGLIGVANPGGTPLSDADIDRIRYAALAEKYLR